MSEEAHDTRVWERLDTLPNHELDALVAAAAAVLAEGADDPEAERALEMPPGPAARELGALLGGAGVSVDEAEVECLISDEAASRQLQVIALADLAQNPSLAAEIEEAWHARRGMMVVDGGVVVAAALLLLVMKLKRVSLKKEGVEIDLYEAKGGVLAAIRSFLGR